jgi:hypothetical protein
MPRLPLPGSLRCAFPVFIDDVVKQALQPRLEGSVPQGRFSGAVYEAQPSVHVKGSFQAAYREDCGEHGQGEPNQQDPERNTGRLKPFVRL